MTAAGAGAKGGTIHGRQVAAPQQSSDGLAAAHLFDHEKADEKPLAAIDQGILSREIQQLKSMA